MAIVFVLILRTSLHASVPSSHLNNKPSLSVLTYDIPIYPHLTVPESSGRVTMLAEAEMRASAFGRRHPFPVLLWCGNRTRTKPGWIFHRATLSFFHYSLLPHRRIEEKVCVQMRDTRKKNYVWQKADLKKKKARWMVKNDGVDEMGERVEWGG